MCIIGMKTTEDELIRLYELDIFELNDNMYVSAAYRADSHAIDKNNTLHQTQVHEPQNAIYPMH